MPGPTGEWYNFEKLVVGMLVLILLLVLYLVLALGGTYLVGAAPTKPWMSMSQGMVGDPASTRFASAYERSNFIGSTGAIESPYINLGGTDTGSADAMAAVNAIDPSEMTTDQINAAQDQLLVSASQGN